MEWLGLLSVAIWLVLLGFRGGFWRFRVDATVPGNPSSPVAVVVPARDESEVIARCARSLVSQEYSGPLHVFVADDHSTDGTAQEAFQGAGESVSKLTVIAAGTLPVGWTGKLWAVSEGIRAAESFHPDYVLLTDADIAHAPGTIAGLVARAEAGKYDLVSYMARLRCESLAERAMIPAFVFFFFKLYPPAWVREARARTAAAAGGCMLVRAEALRRIGGIEAIRGALIDDCTLAAAIKRSGGRIWLGLTNEVESLRAYGSFASVWRMVSRSAFTQLRYSALLLVGTVIGMFVMYLAPVLLTLLAGGNTRLLGALAWLLMTIAYLPAVRFYKLSPLWAALLPLAGLFYAGATIDSAVRYWTGVGGTWKGRVQAQKT